MLNLDEVRAAAAATAKQARFVKIQHTAIDAYAAALPLDMLESPELDPATHYTGAPDQTLAYIVTLDAINFGSGYFPYLNKRAGMSGYFTVASSLKDRWPMTVHELQALDRDECTRIFGQVPGTAPIDELMGLFARALNDLGDYVQTRFAGSFTKLVDSGDGSAEQLAGTLAEMPFYQDVGFYKRAQLTAADLSVGKVAQFRDLHRLTIFADNLVPHVLRVDGVLEYDPELLKKSTSRS